MGHCGRRLLWSFWGRVHWAPSPDLYPGIVRLPSSAFSGGKSVAVPAGNCPYRFACQVVVPARTVAGVNDGDTTTACCYFPR
ncbi:hypothetical protein FsymDg_0653 [Candidatus Protofrankia datiscae]|uniref:Uncharacterized protein n=1 Tax=Candidatus Protofrankia datiscae TaxID=2716812 RepID=F8AV86_9ACTN|nr:hypothetical protein FsymDg_0653 [Candidatus Protofrankia datiscae]